VTDCRTDTKASYNEDTHIRREQPGKDRETLLIAINPQQFPSHLLRRQFPSYL
jgi:hypothetical protein